MLRWGPLATWPEGLSGEGVWRRDGPELPMEYAGVLRGARSRRKSRLSLVIVPGWKRSPVLWSHMGLDDLDDALENLAEQEEEPVGRMGYVDLTDGSHRLGLAPSVRSMIEQWALERSREGRRIDAVIWSNAPPNFEEEGRRFTPRNLIEFILSCPGSEYGDMEEYVRGTPTQLRTPMRAVMERELGWTPFTIVERLGPIQVRAV